MKMPHATAKPVSPVRNLLRCAVCHISFNNSIFDSDNTVSLRSHIGIVGDDNLGNTFIGIQLLEQLHHFNGSLRVECTSRFIGKDNLWLGNQRTGNGHTLALST